jgi:hypothetical protein
MRKGSEKRRNSRWDDAPVHDARSRPKVAAITERDVQRIFSPLARYRYLPADYLHAFAGGSLDALTNRLNLLSRRPNLYVARPQQQRDSAAANHRYLVYELADKGARVLQQHGIECQRGRTPASFAHELMVCQVMASIEIGARASGVRLMTWSDIARSASTPEATRRSPKPHNIPVSITIDGQRIDTHVAPDAQPFGIARPIGDRTQYFLCLGIEADCATEPIDASDFARSSISKKLALYLAIDAQGIHRSHYGFPNFYLPFITTNAARLASVMKLLARMTNGSGSKVLLFKTLPPFTSFEKPLLPSGDMLTEDWQRVGYPPFNFLKS